MKIKPINWRKNYFIGITDEGNKYKVIVLIEYNKNLTDNEFYTLFKDLYSPYNWLELIDYSFYDDKTIIVNPENMRVSGFQKEIKYNIMYVDYCYWSFSLNESISEDDKLYAIACLLNDKKKLYILDNYNVPEDYTTYKIIRTNNLDEYKNQNYDYIFCYNDYNNINCDKDICIKKYINKFYSNLIINENITCEKLLKLSTDLNIIYDFIDYCNKLKITINDYLDYSYDKIIDILCYILDIERKNHKEYKFYEKMDNGIYNDIYHYSLTNIYYNFLLNTDFQEILETSIKDKYLIYKLCFLIDDFKLNFENSDLKLINEYEAFSSVKYKELEEIDYYKKLIIFNDGYCYINHDDYINYVYDTIYNFNLVKKYMENILKYDNYDTKILLENAKLEDFIITSKLYDKTELIKYVNIKDIRYDYKINWLKTVIGDKLLSMYNDEPIDKKFYKDVLEKFI